MTRRELLELLEEMLASCSGEWAHRDAETIFTETTLVPRAELYLDAEKDVEEENVTKALAVAARHRMLGVPLPYLLGTCAFHTVELYINNNVLIPRPDTETLVEVVLCSEPDRSALFADLGTGSGAIAAAICARRSLFYCLAIDISAPALACAHHNVPAQAHLIQMDLFTALKPNHSLSFIVSNPPYISAAEYAQLDPSVRDHEPSLALLGGEDGLDFYRRLAINGKNYLKEGGALYCEIGANQADAVRSLFAAQSWYDITLYHDLAGHSRVVRARSAQQKSPV